MELKLNRETIPAAENIFSGVQEQNVELDYILPDYFPDIFRLLRCEVVPVITEYSVMGDRLAYELRCDIRILYCGEDGKKIQCITQQQSFSRSAELGRTPQSPEVNISARTGNVNYRAVNKRRLDMRCAVSVKICVSGIREQEVISDASGMNIQLLKTPVTIASKCLSAVRDISLSDETEISTAQPPISCIVRSVCTANDCEVKLISGKLLAKGQAQVNVLYSYDEGIEPLEFTVPFSQIIDLDGVDETFLCSVCARTVSCELTPSTDKNGENRILKCELGLKLVCHAMKESQVMIVSDAYSTVYPCETESADITVQRPSENISETFRWSAKLSQGETVPKKVFAVWVTPGNISISIDPEQRVADISGMLTFSMAAQDDSGMMICPDKDEAFEVRVPVPEGMSSQACTELIVGDVSYNISPEGVLTAKAELTAVIAQSSSYTLSALTDIAIDENIRKERDGDYAVKLYYGADNEKIWDIAKRCSTSVEAIIEENDLEGDTLSSGTMLLIPIKD